ncbi:TenA family transcriptional regulator [Mycolicibacterium sp. 22603]|uniref:TenA family transcriptional regulator n=1 Tax=Mycolicibacterium sp. 22603 TaxID=3453950 RepID=UPI003F8496BF
MSDDLWVAATRHPFLDAVRDGTVAAASFDRWLSQDRLFVADLLTFQARLLARAPRSAQGVLAGGCAALVAELDWFDGHAAERGLPSAPEPLPTTLAYRELLQRLDNEPFDAAVTGLWVIERVYLLGWTSAKSADSPYSEFIDHWTVPEFAEYVDGLAVPAQPQRHADLVDSVLRLEVDFWNMAWEDPS